MLISVPEVGAPDESALTMYIDDLLKRNRAFVAGHTPEPPPAAEVKKAFALLERQVEGAGHDLAARNLSELFGPLLGGAEGSGSKRR